MYVIFSFISNVVFIGNLKSLNVGSPLISTIPAFFFNIVFGMIVIPLWIKTPFFEVAVRDMFNVFGRVAINRRAYKVLLFMFLITFPVMTQPLTYYYGYNENGIYYSEFFEFNESFVSYEDINQVNIYFSHNNSGKINSFNYEIVFNNKKKNINKPNSGIKYCSEETLEVHEYIIKNNENIIFNITPLNEEDIKIIEEKMNIENKEILYYLFSLNE